MFVHRNVANLVMHTDMNCLSAMQFAIDVLSVQHIIICGHYGCGGILAALRNERLGLIDNWLRCVQDVHELNRNKLKSLDEKQQHKTLCELNIIEQVANATKTTIVQDAWKHGKPFAIHGWIYDLRDGLLCDLAITIAAEIEIYNTVIAARARLWS